MPTTGIKAATQIAIGAETTPGDISARTRRLVTRNATFRLTEEQEPFEDHMHGALARAVLTPVVTRNLTELEMPMDFDFEQVLLPLLSGVKGDVAPTVPGTGEARLWTFAPDPTVAVDPRTYTLEWVESNFANPADDQALEAGYGFTTEFEIAAAAEGVPEMTVTLQARKAAATAKTALALPVLTRVPNARWTAFIDDTWVGLGTTQMLGQVYGFTYSFSGYLFPQYYLDGRVAADFVTHEFAPRTADLTMDVVHNPAAGKLVPVESAAKQARDRRYVRLQIDGPAFAAPDNGLNHFFRIDGAYQHAPDSMQERGGDRDGNLITRVHLMSVLDPTQNTDVAFAVQNTVSGF